MTHEELSVKIQNTIEDAIIGEANTPALIGLMHTLIRAVLLREKMSKTQIQIEPLPQGYQIVLTTPHNTNCDLDEIDVKKKTALLFGSEVHGCSNEALKYADKLMRIPSYGFTESFNVSVSVSLCLHHLTHKLRKSTINWKLTSDEQNNILLKWLRNSIKASKEIEEKYISENTNK